MSIQDWFDLGRSYTETSLEDQQWRLHVHPSRLVRFLSAIQPWPSILTPPRLRLQVFEAFRAAMWSYIYWVMIIRNLFDAEGLYPGFTP